jgi:hypothetical protein
MMIVVSLQCACSTLAAGELEIARSSEAYVEHQALANAERWRQALPVLARVYEVDREVHAESPEEITSLRHMLRRL